MRHRRLDHFVGATVVALLLAAPAAAGSDDVQDQLDVMHEEIQRLRNENAAMRAEMDVLRRDSLDQALTEQRAAEIRGIVQDILADVDMRASLQDAGLTAGWDNGHFFLQDPYGRFRLQLEGHLQFRFVYNYNGSAQPQDNFRYGFENTRTRMTFRGHAFDETWTYLIRTDFTRNEPALVQGLEFLRDAWIRKQFTESFSVRAGQFKLPFNREELVGPEYQLAVERSGVNESLNIGRSQGIELLWNWQSSRFAFVFSDGGADELGGIPGLFAGGNSRDVLGNQATLPNPTNTPALFEDTEWAFTARYEYLIAGSFIQFRDFTSPIDEAFGMMVGFGAHIQEDEANFSRTPGQVRREWYAYTADLSVEWGGANAFASFIHHYAPNDRQGRGPQNFFGVVVQGGMYLTPEWEVFGRQEWGRIRTDSFSTQDYWLLTLGMNYYIDGHDLKWTTDVGFAFNEVDLFWDFELVGTRGTQGGQTAPQTVVRTQLQLVF